MNTAMLTRLAALKAQPKFINEPATIYNGLRPEDVRRKAEAQLNHLIECLISDPRDTPARRFVLAQVAETLARFPGSDTEDRERMCRYIEQIYEILGVTNSGGLLTRWLYGPVLGTLIVLFRLSKAN